MATHWQSHNRLISELREDQYYCDTWSKFLSVISVDVTRFASLSSNEMTPVGASITFGIITDTYLDCGDCKQTCYSCLIGVDQSDASILPSTLTRLPKALPPSSFLSVNLGSLLTCNILKLLGMVRLFSCDVIKYISSHQHLQSSMRG